MDLVPFLACGYRPRFGDSRDSRRQAKCDLKAQSRTERMNYLDRLEQIDRERFNILRTGHS